MGNQTSQRPYTQRQLRVGELVKQSIGEMIGFVAEMPRPDLELISKASPLGKEFADVIFQLENDLLSV